MEITVETLDILTLVQITMLLQFMGHRNNAPKDEMNALNQLIPIIDR